MVELSHQEAEALTEDAVAVQLKAHSGSLFKALLAAFTAQFGEAAHIEKVGFAKEVVAVIGASRGKTPKPAGVADVEQNFRLLLAELAKLLRQAQQEEHYRRLNNRLNRTVARFLADYPTPTTREHGRLLVDDVQASVEDSEEGDRVKLLTEKLRRDFELNEDLTEPIERFEEFRERVKALMYEERLTKQGREVVAGEGTESDMPDMRSDPGDTGPAKTDGKMPRAVV